MARRMRFRTWCKKDIEDETPIIYTFRMREADGTVDTKHFTSDDTCSFTMLRRIGHAWIESVEKIDNAWYVTIYED